MKIKKGLVYWYEVAMHIDVTGTGVRECAKVRLPCKCLDAMRASSLIEYLNPSSGAVQTGVVDNDRLFENPLFLPLSPPPALTGKTDEEIRAFHDRILKVISDARLSALEGRETNFSSDIDTVGNCANCGVEFHIHKVAEEKTLTEHWGIKSEMPKSLEECRLTNEDLEPVIRLANLYGNSLIIAGACGAVSKKTEDVLIEKVALFLSERDEKHKKEMYCFAEFFGLLGIRAWKINSDRTISWSMNGVNIMTTNDLIAKFKKETDTKTTHHDSK